MDKLLKSLKEIKELVNFDGSISEFVKINSFTIKCDQLKVIPFNIKSSMLPKDSREDFINYLVKVAHNFVMKKKIDTWQELESHPECRKIAKLLFQFGVRGEIFPLEEEGKIKEVEDENYLTFYEFYELYQIQFNYEGSFGSFKKVVEKKYGSFAEYCLERGYSINNTKWESEETAIRVAQKIGSLKKIKEKSLTLFKYLEENNLLDSIFNEKKLSKSQSSTNGHKDDAFLDHFDIHNPNNALPTKIYKKLHSTISPSDLVILLKDVPTGRAISIRQPYVEEILIGKKKYEYRSRSTKIRGRVFLYASNTLGDISNCKKMKIDPKSLPYGFIVGSVEIVDCVYFEKDQVYGYKLKNPIRYEVPIKPDSQPQPLFFFPFGQ